MVLWHQTPNSQFNGRDHLASCECFISKNQTILAPLDLIIGLNSSLIQVASMAILIVESRHVNQSIRYSVFKVINRASQVAATADYAAYSY